MVDIIDNLMVENEAEEVEEDMKKLIDKLIAALKRRGWSAEEILALVEEILK